MTSSDLSKQGDQEINAMKVKCCNWEDGCTWEGELSDMEKHLMKCDSERYPCTYASLGCDVQVMKKNLAEHEKSCAAEHLKLALKKVKSLSLQLKSVEAKLANAIAVRNAATPFPIIFKITDFAARVVDSPPVYSHPRGYKLYLQVYAMGLGITVTACLMHGEFDDELIWPFKGTVTFKMLNQDADADHRLAKAKFQQGRLTEKNKRVSAAQGKSNSGWGVTDMLKFSDADFASFTRGKCIYLEVTSIEVAPENKPWLI